MRTPCLRLLLPAFLLVLTACLLSGCGGGSSSAPVTSAGITATATLSGNVVSVSAVTDRSDLARVWAEITGVSEAVSLTGSGKNWSATAAVSAQPNTIITIKVYAADTFGNTLGPATVQVRMGEYGAQPTVTGLVVNRADNRPVVGATVTLGGQSSGTDSNGRFVITGLVAGTTLEGVVTKSGFAEARFTVTVTSGTVDLGRITLTATQDLPPPVPNFP